jgi:hypothetical protein
VRTCLQETLSTPPSTCQKDSTLVDADDSTISLCRRSQKKIRESLTDDSTISLCRRSQRKIRESLRRREELEKVREMLVGSGTPNRLSFGTLSPSTSPALRSNVPASASPPPPSRLSLSATAPETQTAVSLPQTAVSRSRPEFHIVSKDDGRGSSDEASARDAHDGGEGAAAGQGGKEKGELVPKPARAQEPIIDLFAVD